MAELLTIVLLAALAAFIAWESFRSPKLSREEMEKGFEPGRSAARLGLLVCAGVMLYWGIESWMHPSHPPFQGRGALFFSALYAAFGPRGEPVVSWILAAIMIFALLIQWTKRR